MTMRSITLAALVLLGLTSTPALAQTANKTWVSSASGNDTGTCQFVAPCKTFAYAITQTAAGGEIDVKDSGSYGVVTITKAVSIVGNGALAAVAVPSGAVGVTISAGTSDKVVLQGLVIDGHGVGSDGIAVNSAGSLTVTDSHIRNVALSGISLGSSNAPYYHISNVEVSNAQYGIVINYSNGSLHQVEMHENHYGVDINGGSAVVTDSVIDKNVVGIYFAGGGNVVLSQTVIAFNSQYGIDVGGGTASSYGDNDIYGNAADINGSLSSLQKR